MKQNRVKSRSTRSTTATTPNKSRYTSKSTMSTLNTVQKQTRPGLISPTNTSFVRAYATPSRVEANPGSAMTRRTFSSSLYNLPSPTVGTLSSSKHNEDAAFHRASSLNTMEISSSSLPLHTRRGHTDELTRPRPKTQLESSVHHHKKQSHIQPRFHQDAAFQKRSYSSTPSRQPAFIPPPPTGLPASPNQRNTSAQFGHNIHKHSIDAYLTQRPVFSRAFNPSLMTFAAVKPVRRKGQSSSPINSAPSQNEAPTQSSNENPSDNENQSADNTSPPGIVEVDFSKLSYRQKGLVYIFKALDHVLWAGSIYVGMYAASFIAAYLLCSQGGLHDVMKNFLDSAPLFKGMAETVDKHPQSADLLLAYFITSSTDWMRLPILFYFMQRKFNPTGKSLTLPSNEYDMVLQKVSMGAILKYKFKSTTDLIKQQKEQSERAQRHAAYEQAARKQQTSDASQSPTKTPSDSPNQTTAQPATDSTNTPKDTTHVN